MCKLTCVRWVGIGPEEGHLQPAHFAGHPCACIPLLSLPQRDLTAARTESARLAASVARLEAELESSQLQVQQLAADLEAAPYFADQGGQRSGWGLFAVCVLSGAGMQAALGMVCPMLASCWAAGRTHAQVATAPKVVLLCIPLGPSKPKHPRPPCCTPCHAFLAGR